MTSSAKVLVPNKEWIIRQDNSKVGSVAKAKRGYLFIKNGKSLFFKNVEEINNKFGVDINEAKVVKLTQPEVADYKIYDYPCSSKPFEPVYNIKKRLPLFAKSSKSKSQYCAGYYVIKFRKGWVKSFCPKLITLERYPFHGPYKTEAEMKNILNIVNKHETT